MKIKDEQSNEVAIKKEAGAVANIDLEQFADAGFDNVDFLKFWDSCHHK